MLISFSKDSRGKQKGDEEGLEVCSEYGSFRGWRPNGEAGRTQRHSGGEIRWEPEAKAYDSQGPRP